jgi:hypothetical protein
VVLVFSLPRNYFKFMARAEAKFRYALGLRLRLGIALCSALCAARCPEPVHLQDMYEPYLLTAFPLLQPRSYQAGSPLLGGPAAATLPPSDCGSKEQLGRQGQPHEGLGGRGKNFTFPQHRP